MKELNDIDKLIRSSLADYKPVPETKSKERFLAAATKLWTAGNGSSINWKTTLLLAALLLGSIGIMYYYLPAVRSANDNKLSVVSNNEQEKITKADAPEVASASLKSTISEKEHIPANKKTQETKENTKTENNNNKSTFYSPPVIASSKPEQTTNVQHMTNPATADKWDRRYISKIRSCSLQDIASSTDITDELLSREYKVILLPLPLPQEKEYRPPLKTNRMLNMAYSLHYRPELVFNIIDDNKVVHNIGLDVQFKLFDNKYIIRTGVATSLSKGYNEYAVLYNEYLGSYNGIDSITFAWDENHYHLIPTYYMSEREVFDTAIQTDISRVYKRYTYLQIPLVLGYDFITNSQFSLGVRFGPTFSALLSSKTISDDYDPEKNNIIQINQITPDRIHTNWLLMAGLNIGIYSKKKLFYEIEPQFSYYFNSVYQKYDSSKPPFSIGFRLAIGIK